MTRISFFHGANDRLHATAQWVAEAHRKSTPVLIYAPREEYAEMLDRLLWTQTSLGFTPHCRTNAALASETPVLITTELNVPTDGRTLVNLSDDIPAGFERFSHIVEIISSRDEVRLPGRDRFRFYREQGCSIESHDISQNA
ncbi:MAG: DNA polymerase III subunit chi [Rugosibacter sp.]|nr:DNA polymerase III subunit chi [Rugosibacter sp.]